MRKRELSLGLVAFMVIQGDSGVACQEPAAALESTRLTMLMVRRALASYVADSGRLPDSLSGLCAVSRPGCVGLSPAQHPRDGWGNELGYRLTDAEYELRSRGPDRIASTSDDVVFKPATERALVSKFAGCYTVNWAAWWDRFPGDRVELQATAIQEGFYRLEPQPTVPKAAWWWGG